MQLCEKIKQTRCVEITCRLIGLLTLSVLIAKAPLPNISLSNLALLLAQNNINSGMCYRYSGYIDGRYDSDVVCDGEFKCPDNMTGCHIKKRPDTCE